jgi:hypothetical protein
VRTHQHLDFPFDLDRLPVKSRAQVVTDRQSIEFGAGLFLIARAAGLG